MMARLTRKFLEALGIEDENKIEQIISAHTEATDALKDQRDEYKEAFEKLPKVEKELNSLKEKHKDDGENPYEVKYKALKEDFDNYKKEQTAKEEKAAKKSLYKALLKEAGINEKRIEAVLKVTNLDNVEIEDGKIKDSENVITNIKEEWADFIVETTVNGADTATPPNTNKSTGVDTSNAQNLVRQMRANKYGNTYKEDK